MSLGVNIRKCPFRNDTLCDYGVLSQTRQGFLRNILYMYHITFQKYAKFRITLHIWPLETCIILRTCIRAQPFLCSVATFFSGFYNWWSEWCWYVFTASSSLGMFTNGRLCVTKLPLTKHITVVWVQHFGAILSTTVKELGRIVSTKLLSHFILWTIYFCVSTLL